MPTLFKNRQIQSGSTAVRIPIGDGTNRPDSPVFGMIRYNTNIGYCEFYNGTIWQNMGVGGVVSYTVDSFTGDGSTTQFTMSETASSADQLIVFVGSIYQQPTDYSVDGSYVITFSAAPPDTIPINVIHTNN